MPSLDEVEPRIGDIIAATRTFEVVDVRYDTLSGDPVYVVQDVDSGERFTLRQAGSLAINLLIRKEPEFREGQIVSPGLQPDWKPPTGTVIVRLGEPDAVYILDPYGIWRNRSGHRRWVSRQDDLYKIVYLPTEH